jgi:hypothetical protein
MRIPRRAGDSGKARIAKHVRSYGRAPPTVLSIARTMTLAGNCGSRGISSRPQEPTATCLLLPRSPVPSA